jgi:hypothetical protein
LTVNSGACSYAQQIKWANEPTLSPWPQRARCLYGAARQSTVERYDGVVSCTPGHPCHGRWLKAVEVTERLKPCFVEDPEEECEVAMPFSWAGSRKLGKQAVGWAALSSLHIQQNKQATSQCPPWRTSSSENEVTLTDQDSIKRRHS